MRKWWRRRIRRNSFFTYAICITGAMQEQSEKVIVIGGGVGPYAGTVLHQHVITHTLTDGTDQTHFRIVHSSNSADIPDRTEALRTGKIDPPVNAMCDQMQDGVDAATRRGYLAVGGVPCNTFHASLIWNRFLQRLQERGIDIQLVHMIEEVAVHLQKICGPNAAVGLLSTTGTRQAGFYRTILASKGMRVIEVPEGQQDDVHNAIYDRTQGIKAVTPVTDWARQRFEGFADHLIAQGADALILGCTEIPLALPGTQFKGKPLVDPMVALARGLIREANPEKLKLI